MKRISNEDGLNAGWRNQGRLSLFLIPAALGGAAVLWIVAAVGWIDLTHELRMERRTLQSVGISVLPRAPIALLAHDALCLKVESSYMDGDRLQFYVRNGCRRWLDFPTYSYRLKAHDGTVVGSHVWSFDGDKQIGPGERREQPVTLHADDRVESVELWVID